MQPRHLYIKKKFKEEKKSCFFIKMKMLNANYSLTKKKKKKIRVCKKIDKNIYRKMKKKQNKMGNICKNV